MSNEPKIIPQDGREIVDYVYLIWSGDAVVRLDYKKS